jgi:shikimate kinase
VTNPLDVQRLTSGGFVVWLRADMATLAKRVAGTDRPFLGTTPEAAMSHLYAGRATLYSAASTFIVDEDQTTPELIALEIAGELMRERLALC